MDDLIKAIAGLFGAFKDPATIAFLLISCAEAFIIWKMGKWFMDRADKDMESRTQLATVLNRWADLVEDSKNAPKHG